MLARMRPVKEAHSAGAGRAAGGAHADGAAGIDASRFRCDLLAWYDAEKRDMPWRGSCDPYAILVSEVMLQQTQVSRVEEYWRSFLERFPTVDSLAAASEDDVCSAWSGLGYYRRARNLRKAAGEIVRSGGDVPRTADELRELPGIGAYTAAAVASIAFGEAVAVLDANVVRVLARLTAEGEDVTRARARRRLERLAGELLDPRRPGDFNQAMMELGALVCSPTSPRCDGCAVSSHCAALRGGDPERFPITRSPGRTNEMHETAAVVVRRGRVLLTTASDERGWWPGLWRLPRVVSDGSGERGRDREALRAHILESYGLDCARFSDVATTTYGVTTNRVTLSVVSCASPAGRLRRASDRRWLTLEEALSLGIPAADRRVLEEYGARLLATPAPGR